MGYNETREPDLEEIQERLWELYVSWCINTGVEPKMDSFQIWLDERFD